MKLLQSSYREGLHEAPIERSLFHRHTHILVFFPTDTGGTSLQFGLHKAPVMVL